MKQIVLCCLLTTVLGRTTVTLEELLHGKNVSNKLLAGNTVDSASLLDKIVGGIETEPGDLTWQASLKTLSLKDGVWQFIHVCGATIISEYWLLSAAHCFKDSPKWKWQVTVGEFNLSQEDVGEQVLEVESIYNHELYNIEKHVDYDVALIKIKPSFDGSGIKFSEFVSLACIDFTGRYPTPQSGDLLLVSGWGALKEGGNSPDVPHAAEVLLIDQRECESYYPYRITSRMFCAGFPEGEIDSCQGDSGGPVVYGIQGYPFLYGIVSWGDGCARTNNPGVYSSVSEFTSWIRETVRYNSDNINQNELPCFIG